MPFDFVLLASLSIGVVSVAKGAFRWCEIMPHSSGATASVGRPLRIRPGGVGIGKKECFGKGVFAKVSIPDPPTLAFLEKSKGNPEKSKGFSLRGNPKILGKERKNPSKKQGKSENEKSKEIEKSKDWRVRDFLLSTPKSERFLRFAIAHRGPQKSLAISETLRFRDAMESR